MKYLTNKRRLILISIDVTIIASTYLFAYLLALIPNYDKFAGVGRHALNFVICTLCVLTARLAVRVYSNVWRYANSRAYLDLVFADVLGGAVAFGISYIVGESCYIGGWESVAIVAMMNSLTLVSRFLYQQRHKRIASNKSERIDNKITVAIVGAGQVGALLAEELLSYKGSHYRPVCFVDRNSSKVGSRVAGIPVYLECDDTLNKLAEYPVQEIFIAIPQLQGKEAQDILDYYGRLGCKVKIYDFPRQNDLPDGESRRVIRDFKIEDLLFRNTIDVTDDATKYFYKDKVVLITGGGGSIGSELSRQVAKCQPKKLVIFDIYENNAYDIQQELIRRYGDKLDLSVEIGSVRDRVRLNAVFAHYRPEIVFHAAAHKHVPLMEHSNCEAIILRTQFVFNETVSA